MWEIKLMRPAYLIFAAVLSFIVGGCNPEDLFASDFKKFSKCVESTSKDGLVQKTVARNACALKYSTEKTLTQVTGSGQFACYSDDMCDTFSVDVSNATRRNIITAIHVTVTAKGREYAGENSTPIWIEPGYSASTFAKFDTKLSREARDGHTWTFSGFRGIEIDG